MPVTMPRNLRTQKTFLRLQVFYVFLILWGFCQRISVLRLLNFCFRLRSERFHHRGQQQQAVTALRICSLGPQNEVLNPAQVNGIIAHWFHFDKTIISSALETKIISFQLEILWYIFSARSPGLLRCAHAEVPCSHWWLLLSITHIYIYMVVDLNSFHLESAFSREKKLLSRTPCLTFANFRDV